MEKYNHLNNRVELTANLVLNGVVYGDVDIELGEDQSGLILHLPEKVPGYHPGTEYQVTCTLVQEESKIPLFKAIEIREQLMKVIKEFDDLIKVSKNKEQSSDTHLALQDMRKDVAIRLEKLDNKLREISV